MPQDTSAPPPTPPLIAPPAGDMKHAAATHSLNDSAASQRDDSEASSSASSSDASRTRQQQLLDAAFQRAASLMAPSEMPQRLTKNYKELARDFRMLKPFTRLPDGTYPLHTQCVFCEIGSPKTVFFPCQHKCVCDICIKLHDISSDHTRPAAWGACPVCMTDIRLMLPYSGNEEDEYWRWIAEVKPSLPLAFKHEFKDAAKKLRKNAVLPGGPPTADDAPSPLGTLQKQPSNRRHTWSASHEQQTHGHAGVDPKTCAIL